MRSPPFAGAEALAMMELVKAGTRPELVATNPNLSADIAEMIGMCWQHKPERRPDMLVVVANLMMASAAAAAKEKERQRLLEAEATAAKHKLEEETAAAEREWQRQQEGVQASAAERARQQQEEAARAEEVLQERLRQQERERVAREASAQAAAAAAAAATAAETNNPFASTNPFSNSGGEVDVKDETPAAPSGALMAAAPSVLPLENQPWYHGGIARPACEALLLGPACGPGSFCIRVSMGVTLTPSRSGNQCR